MEKPKMLMLGAGYGAPVRRLLTPAYPVFVETDWTTLDVNSAAKPDVLFDLNNIEHGNRLPFPDETFDELHMYEVIEHYGRQGDYAGFFRGFRELWRVLKPGAYLVGTTPGNLSRWTWGDPGHVRMVNGGVLSFLTRKRYEELGATAATDYREYVDPCWWELVHNVENENGCAFGLRKSQ